MFCNHKLWYIPHALRIMPDEMSIILSVSEAMIKWGRVTHLCISKLTIIGSDNGLSPSRRWAIIWANDRIF